MPPQQMCLRILKYSITITIVFLLLTITENICPTFGYEVAVSPSQYNHKQLFDSESDEPRTLPLIASNHHLSKRMDLELCLGQFDVHKNTIIRTGESQAIGGKYLQGLELETMEECQRLCCETESCDVYIFESKKDGYCYLFECGTPENFHCKFTRHSNYTSAVLTPMIRRVSDVTTARPQLPHIPTNNVSQQEWELSNLKVKPDKTQELLMPTVGTMSKNAVSGEGAAKVNATAQCGRFQFACHSGECIAVYNACDGIPQCEDGSDEGPECSGANNANSISTVAVAKTSHDIKATVPLVGAANTQFAPSLIQQNAQQQLQNMQQQRTQNIQNNAETAVNNREDPNVWESRKNAANTQRQPVLGNANLHNGNPDAHQMTAAANGDSFTAYVNQRAPSAAAAINAAGSAHGSVSNPNYVSTIEQSGLYMPANNHLLQDSGATNVLYPQTLPQSTQNQQHILLPPPPPPPPAPVNSNWQQEAILKQQQQQKQLQLQQAGSGVATVPLQNSQQLPLQPPQSSGSAYAAANTEGLQQQQQQQQQQSILSQTAPNMVPSLQSKAISNQIQPQQPVAVAPSNVNSKGVIQDSDEYEDDSEEQSTEPPKKHKHKKQKSKAKVTKTKSEDPIEESLKQQLQEQQQLPQSEADIKANLKAIKTAISPVHEQYEMIHQNMALEFRDHDGQSERPGGAVLSLTLGLLITAALAILIGCRMRTVGRRARRMGGKTPYSHEADFLVNGMYL